MLTQEQLNAIAAGSGYTGGTFGSTGLAATPQVSNQSLGLAPVSVLSSNTGKNIVNQNTASLQKIESGYMGPSIVDYLNSTGQGSDFASRSKLAGEKGITGYKGTGEQNTQLLQALRNVSSSPASSAMVNDINTATSGGVGMTSSEQQGLSDLQKKQDALTASAAKARAALEAKDYKDMDYWTAKADEDRKTYESQLSDYYASTADLRKQLTGAMTPGAKEQQLSKDLVSIRGQADAFKLQTEQDKFREYEGQTMAFAGGRASEIDRKASFRNQEFALSEKNLLLSLGLEQDARKYTREAAEQGLTYIKDDFDLQTKVQDKLNLQEEKLFEKADKLEDDAKSTLMDILDELQGVDPSKLDADSLKQLETLSARGGVPFNLVTEALKTQYNKQVFEDALKTAQERRLSQDDDKLESSSNFTDIMQQVIDADGSPEQAAREAAAVSEASGVPVDQKTLNKWTEQARKLKKTPAPAEVVLPESKPVTAYGAGQAVNKEVAGTLKYLPESVYETVNKSAGAVGSFFEGLFGF